MIKFLKGFRECESGAVSIDWVVLTAALVGLGLGIVVSISVAAQDPANGISVSLADQTVGD